MKVHQIAVIDMFKELKPGTLLDAGSGGDEMGRKLKESGFDVFSLDLYSEPGLKGRFVRADMNSPLPFAEGVFDYVLCSESLQYLENHGGLFRELRRVLKKGGCAIVSIPNILNAASRLYFLHRGYFPSFKPVRTIDSKKEWDSFVYHPISFVEVIELAKKNRFRLAGLKASKVKASSRPLYPLLKALYGLGLLFERNPGKADLLRSLSSSEALLGDHLIIRMEKEG